MSCSEFDLKAYFLDELSAPERQQVREHVRLCARCGDELEALATTRAALLSVPEEEPPRRIAFVSDKVFEPKWWQRLWHSGPQLGFASAGVLAFAIVLQAFLTPADRGNSQPVPTLDQVAIQKVVDAAVSKAVAESEARHKLELQQVVEERLQQVERRHAEVLAVMQAGYEERMQRLRQANGVRLRNAYYDTGVFQQ